MVELFLDGRPAPPSLLVNLQYELEVRVDGRTPAATTWSVMQGLTRLAEGHGNRVIFAPVKLTPCLVHVQATTSDGFSQEDVFSFNVRARGVPVSLGINWRSLTYHSGDTIRADLKINDPEGHPTTALAWVLYRNNVAFASGGTAQVQFQTSFSGVYRIKATAQDINGAILAGDSAVSVSDGFEVQASYQPPPVPPSCVYLAALYTWELVGEGGPATALPYTLASLSQELVLPPGTTHVSFDLDPNQNLVDDEVVVRTPTGNWTLRNALTTEKIGYDYFGGQPLLPAPVDGRLRTTVEAFKVHGPVAGAFSFRVRVKCWRQGAPLYRYEPCPFSRHPGGAGPRFRLFAAVITKIDLQADLYSGLNRPGTGLEVIECQTPEVSHIPYLNLNTTGAPNIVDPGTSYFHTDSNWLATYEPVDDEVGEFDARAVAGLEGVRPFHLLLVQPGTPPLVQRIKRLHGTIAVYIAQGGLSKGALLRLRISTSKLYAGVPAVTLDVPVTETVFNNREDVFVKAASAPIDLTDFQFSQSGLEILFTVFENAVTPPPACDYPPDPAWPEGAFYSSLKAPALSFDGACFSRGEAQESVDIRAAGRAVALEGCEDVLCGPNGTYCYTRLDGLAQTNVIQPLYRPSPFISLKDDPFTCYGQPVLFAGTIAPPPPTPAPVVPSEVEAGFVQTAFAEGLLEGTLPPVSPFGADEAVSTTAFALGALETELPYWDPENPGVNPFAPCNISSPGVLTMELTSNYAWASPDATLNPNLELGEEEALFGVSILEFELQNAIADLVANGNIIRAISPPFWLHFGGEVFYKSGHAKFQGGDPDPDSPVGELPTNIRFDGAYLLARQICYEPVGIGTVFQVQGDGDYQVGGGDPFRVQLSGTIPPPALDPFTDELGNGVVDENGNPITFTQP